MKKNHAGIGQILVGQAKADAEARVNREAEERAARTAAKNAARARRQLERALPTKAGGGPKVKL
jgi:hypothetical protein